ncbi:MAG: 3-deoxy-D-manno-octulosonic acid transferase, partial [Alphaproteobacteria bacterium]|nr:3-deoxy-D-manno-octulosonic acid transferase [Alphaproteobacteria bacterium]
IILFLFFRIIQGKEDKSRIKERFGLSKRRRPKRTVIWIHAASVGESVSVLPFLNLFKDNAKYFIIFTSGTITSGKLVKNKLPKNAIHQYAPTENYFAIKNFLNHWKPKLTIFLESEFWPCILYETSKCSKLISLNTKISDTSYKRWTKLDTIFKEISSLFTLFLPQSSQTYNRLKKLGVKNLHYTGNLKYTVPPLPTIDTKLSSLKSSLKNRTPILFASSHPGEEKVIIDVYERLKEKHKSLIIIIAPRHPNRSESIVSLLKKYNYNISVRSKRTEIKNDTEFYIADTIGELGTLFRIAPISVICGSFVNIGGHNPIEAAKLKSAIIMGPYISGFREICGEFKKYKAAIFVKNRKECSRAIHSLLSNKETHKRYVYNALTFINTKKNILKDTMLKIKQYLK